MLEKIRKIVSYPALLIDRNKWKSMYESVNNNFMKSSYKHILNFERQQRQLEDAEEKILELKEKLAVATKDDEKLRIVKSLKERRNKNVQIKK